MEVKCFRADEIFTPTSIIEDIRQNIRNAQFLIADLTEKNPNVLYELGFAHGIEKNVILIARKMEDVPFDLRHLRIAKYEDNASGLQKLRNSLQSMIPNLMKELRIPSGGVFTSASAIPSEMNKKLGSVGKEQHRLNEAIKFLKRTGRSVESIQSYDDLREVCHDSGYNLDNRWHITIDYMNALPEIIPKTIINNVLVLMAFLGSKYHELKKAREILLQNAVTGPYILSREWLDSELRYREKYVAELKQSLAEMER